MDRPDPGPLFDQDSEILGIPNPAKNPKEDSRIEIPASLILQDRYYSRSRVGIDLVSMFTSIANALVAH